MIFGYEIRVTAKRSRWYVISYCIIQIHTLKSYKCNLYTKQKPTSLTFHLLAFSFGRATILMSQSFALLNIYQRIVFFKEPFTANDLVSRSIELTGKTSPSGVANWLRHSVLNHVRSNHMGSNPFVGTMNHRPTANSAVHPSEVCK